MDLNVNAGSICSNVQTLKFELKCTRGNYYYCNIINLFSYLADYPPKRIEASDVYLNVSRNFNFGVNLEHEYERQRFYGAHYARGVSVGVGQYGTGAKPGNTAPTSVELYNWRRAYFCRDLSIVPVPQIISTTSPTLSACSNLWTTELPLNCPITQ